MHRGGKQAASKLQHHLFHVGEQEPFLDMNLQMKAGGGEV